MGDVGTPLASPDASWPHACLHSVLSPPLLYTQHYAEMCEGAGCLATLTEAEIFAMLDLQGAVMTVGGRWVEGCAGIRPGQGWRAHPTAPQLRQPCGCRARLPPRAQLLRPVDAARLILAAQPYITDLTQICAW